MSSSVLGKTSHGSCDDSSCSGAAAGAAGAQPQHHSEVDRGHVDAVSAVGEEGGDTDEDVVRDIHPRLHRRQVCH
jgi:hypothetical protein